LGSGACDTHGGLERYRRKWEDIIKIVIQGMGFGGGGMDWIAVVQDRNRWRALVNAIRNPRVFWEFHVQLMDLLASQERLCPMETASQLVMKLKYFSLFTL